MPNWETFLLGLLRFRFILLDIYLVRKMQVCYDSRMSRNVRRREMRCNARSYHLMPPSYCRRRPKSVLSPADKARALHPYKLCPR